METLREVYFGSFCLPRLEIFGYSQVLGILGRLSHENQPSVECLVVRFATEKRSASKHQGGIGQIGSVISAICAALCLSSCCLLVKGVLIVAGVIASLELVV